MSVSVRALEYWLAGPPNFDIYFLLTRFIWLWPYTDLQLTYSHFPDTISFLSLLTTDSALFLNYIYLLFILPHVHLVCLFFYIYLCVCFLYAPLPDSHPMLRKSPLLQTHLILDYPCLRLILCQMIYSDHIHI